MNLMQEDKRTSLREDPNVAEVEMTIRSVDARIKDLNRDLVAQCRQVESARRAADGVDPGMSPRQYERLKAKQTEAEVALAQTEKALAEEKRRRENLPSILAERLAQAKRQRAPEALARYAEKVRAVAETGDKFSQQLIELEAEAAFLRAEFGDENGLLELGPGVDPTLTCLAGRGVFGFYQEFVASNGKWSRWVERAKYLKLV